MRAYDIALFIILVQGAIAFVDGTGMFEQHFVNVPSNNASYTLSDLESYQSGTNESTIFSDQDDWNMLSGAWEAIKIGIKILFSVLFVLPTLMDVFGIDILLAAFLQVGVYFIYATAYLQFVSNRGFKQYE